MVQVMGQIGGFGITKSGPDGEDGPVSWVVHILDITKWWTRIRRTYLLTFRYTFR